MNELARNQAPAPLGAMGGLSQRVAGERMSP